MEPDNAGTIDKSKKLKLEITSSTPESDAVLQFLERGDFRSATSSEQWLMRESEDMLYWKSRDCYAAAVGAYVLLAMRQFELLNDWPRNLANRYPVFSDGCVIWAWQLLSCNPDPAGREEAAKYLRIACTRGLPVYTRGLRMLIDALKLYPDIQSLNTYLRQTLNHLPLVNWEVPLTTVCRFPEKSPVGLQISFAPGKY